MKKIVGMLLTAVLLNASNISVSNSLTLDEAIEILKAENLEIKTASLDINSANEEVKTVTGTNWGKLDFVQDYANSDDAGNVFGFKLTSREATFGDFGFGASNMPAQTDPAYLTTPPSTLNYPDAQNFLARDKEMSEYSSLTFGVGVYYEVDNKWLPYIDRTTINLQIDHMQFDYKNFRNATGRLDGSSAYSPGEEPLYSLKANVIRFFVSVFY